MDPSDFERELAAAIADELREAAPRLAGRVLRSVALDVHPWHGHINLAVLTDDDPPYASRREQRAEMASWQLFEIVPAPWPRAAGAAAAMRAAYQANRGTGDAFLAAAARSLDDARVTDVLAAYPLAPEFERFVGHPDDPDQRNLCR